MSAPARRRLWIVLTTLVAAGVLGLGIGVQAERDPTPAVQPYDPMPRW
ncbi:hypothetical protein [Falsiroseomonas sp. HW251]